MDKGNINVHIFQNGLPFYRVPFFSSLYKRGLKITVHTPLKKDSIFKYYRDFTWVNYLGETISFLDIFYFQKGIFGVKFSKKDIIVIPGEPRNLSFMFIILIARIRGIPIVWWGHYWSSTSSKKNLKLRILLAKLCSSIIFYTDREVENFKSKFSTKKNIYALNNGPNIKEINKYRKKYIPELRKYELVFIGRLTKKSQLENLIHALSILKSSGFYCLLNVIGIGKEEESLKLLSSQLNVSDLVKWHGSIFSEKKIAEVMNISKLFVYPGAVGLSLTHAFAYGIPAVIHSNKSKHMPEIAAFKDGENGYSYDLNSVNSLAITIKKAIENDNTLNMMSVNALKIITEKYNIEMMTKNFENMIYETYQNHISK